MNPIALIAALCAIHTGSPREADKQQAYCQAYYIQCSLDLGGKRPEDQIKICTMSRPAQIFHDEMMGQKK